MQAEDGRLKKYDIWTSIDELAGGDVLKWDSVLELNNSTLLMKYSLMADKAHIEANMRHAIDNKYKNG